MIKSKSVTTLAIFACLLLRPTAGHSASAGGAGVLEAGSLCPTLVSEMAVLASSKEDCRPMPVPVPRTSDKVNGEITCMFQPRLGSKHPKMIIESFRGLSLILQHGSCRNHQ